jgi:outer membrane protein
MIRSLLIMIVCVLVFTAYGQDPVRLTLAEAEQMALKNNPAIGAAEFGALATKERIEQAEAARQPFVTANFTGAGAPEDTRLAAGALNNPVIYSRLATGVSISQLLFDFGRTSQIVQGSKYASQADNERTRATKADIILSVRRAYYAALRSKTLVDIAKYTIEGRQLIVDQVAALVKAQLKSGLDLSFASTNLAEAKLLLATAENERLASHAQLAEAMGYANAPIFELAEEPTPNVEPLSITELTQQALQKRPELIAARLDTDSSRSFAAAEKSSRYPSVTATAGAGLIPNRVKSLSNDYAAVGFNISLPFLNGGLFKARQAEAEFRARSAERRVRQIENAIARDVNIALLDVNTAAERITLTRQFIEQAAQAMELAQARYDLGLSSIVELSQAQLVKTNAEIQFASARYDYQTRRSVLFHRAGLLN